MTMAKASNVRNRYSEVENDKAVGATYTPERLADFVADRIVSIADLPLGRTIRVLDPAVGHGELLVSLLSRLGANVEVHGYETDLVALEVARERLSTVFPSIKLCLHNRSFIDHVLEDFPGGLFGNAENYDLIIANPPYVRTQIIGAEQAQLLSAQFGLGGRVDLYHAFLLAMTRVLAPDGAAGFIVSNRFMTTKAGASTRAAMLSDLNLKHVYDLGDTKLFDAAVLPAILVARGNQMQGTAPAFTSIYASKAASTHAATDPISALAFEGAVKMPDGQCFVVAHGILDNGGDPSGTWRLASDSVEAWLGTVKHRTWGTFGAVGKIRVGVKTCADKVFIPKKWDEDLELLRPLTTHHTARRFRPEEPNRQILYPHEIRDGVRQPVLLEDYPRSRAYLETHRATLEGRSYVMEAGRNWYELWVPQNPADWPGPKLVFRDISEEPTFWMDLVGTVVNGDCYWLTGQEDLLWLALAVGNSTFIERFYDRKFNNKLYAGRRRFITQYVEQFPLPDPQILGTRHIIKLCKELYGRLAVAPAPELERELNTLIWEAFGLPVEEI